MADPLADLDNLLNELDKTSRAPAPKSNTSAPFPSAAPVKQSAPAPTTTATPANNNDQWKNELEGLLSELSVSTPSSSASAAPTTVTPTPVAASAVRTVMSGPPPTYTDGDYQKIEYVSGGPAITLTSDEEALVRELNKVRTNPAAYATILENERKPYFDGKNLKLPNSNVILVTEEGNAAVDEAIKFLRNEKALPPFNVAAGMTKAAKEAIEEVGKIGETSCESIRRFDQYGRFEQEAVEIASFGTSDAREIVIRFLVCDGQPDRIQRTYIFEPIYKAIGLAIGEHNSQYKIMACVNFTKAFHHK